MRSAGEHRDCRKVKLNIGFLGGVDRPRAFGFLAAGQ
jgi:hypothetical protein